MEEVVMVMQEATAEIILFRIEMVELGELGEGLDCSFFRAFFKRRLAASQEVIRSVNLLASSMWKEVRKFNESASS